MYNTIIAYAKDSQASCQWSSQTGSVTLEKERFLADTQSWGGAYGVAGVPGKFMYYLNDYINKASQVSYTIVGSSWVAGILPNNIVDCICLVREDLSSLYLSFDGVTFKPN